MSEIPIAQNNAAKTDIYKEGIWVHCETCSYSSLCGELTRGIMLSVEKL